MNSVKFLCFMIAIVLQCSCKPNNNTQQKAENNLGQVHAGALAGLFRDNPENPTALMENIKQGTGCGIVKRGEVSFVFHPWPAPLKAFLATELAKFPLAKQISEFSEGLYLVAAQF